MGRIKTKLIKRVTHEILDRHSDKVKSNFEENKAVVNQVADIQSKKIRNTIAGYITRIVKAQKQ